MFVVIPPETVNYGLDILARAICQVGEKLHFRTWEVASKLGVDHSHKEDVFIFLAPQVLPQWRHTPGYRIVFNVHPTCPGRQYHELYRRNFRTFVDLSNTGRIDAIFEYNKHTSEWMVKAGLPAFFVPVGYHESFEMAPVAPMYKKPGVFFLGTLCGNRRNWFKCNQWAKAHDFQKCQWKRPTLIHSDGVHLNSFIRNFRTFLSLRVISLLLSNKCCVLSEPSDWSPLTNGQHWVVADLKNFQRKAEWLLENQSRRREIGFCGYEFIKKHHRLHDHFEEALTQFGIL